MRLKLIACEALYRELCAAVARSVNQVDLEFLPKGLHDLGSDRMRARVQEVVDRFEGTGYETIVFGYGLCGNGLAGLAARSLPLVFPRAHDCITLFMGSRERYAEYFRSHPGVYFKTSGWIERGRNLDSQLSLNFEDLAARYGEENARYLHEELTRHYGRLAYIRMGVEPDARFEDQIRREADERGWTFERIEGDMALIQQLVDGPWEEHRFVTVPPGWRLAVSHDESILRAERL